MSQVTSNTHQAIQDEKLTAIKALAQATVKPQRAPILRTPADYGMDYEDIFFPSFDGVPLEGWFMPADSNKLIICNHPMTMNRYGFPSHLEPWNLFNDFEVNFVKVYAALQKNGYNVLAYDLRNHGASGTANNGVCGVGLYEWRDVIGAMQYVQNNERLNQMEIGLFNPCAGGNAAMVAISKHPDFFENVKAFACPQPASMNIGMKEIATLQGLGTWMNWMKSNVS